MSRDLPLRCNCGEIDGNGVPGGALRCASTRNWIPVRQTWKRGAARSEDGKREEKGKPTSMYADLSRASSIIVAALRFDLYFWAARGASHGLVLQPSFASDRRSKLSYTVSIRYMCLLHVPRRITGG